MALPLYQQRRLSLSNHGVTLILDANEIIPDDPGAGTPAIVRAGRYSGTYHTACDIGELDCGYYQLNDTQVRWLQSQAGLVDTFLDFWTDVETPDDEHDR